MNIKFIPNGKCKLEDEHKETPILCVYGSYLGQSEQCIKTLVIDGNLQSAYNAVLKAVNRNGKK